VSAIIVYGSPQMLARAVHAHRKKKRKKNPGGTGLYLLGFAIVGFGLLLLNRQKIEQMIRDRIPDAVGG